jgi:predicted component of type VI protein secretion system
MAHRPRLSELSPDELLTRAHQYRSMAATASTPDTRDALNTLAIRYAMLAAEREVSQQQGGAEEGRAC